MVDNLYEEQPIIDKLTKVYKKTMSYGPFTLNYRRELIELILLPFGVCKVGRITKRKPDGTYYTIAMPVDSSIKLGGKIAQRPLLRYGTFVYFAKCRVK